jgi:DNA-binding ferritin-like protein
VETDTVQIPKKMLEDIYDAHEKIDQILETLEVLVDEVAEKICFICKNKSNLNHP